MVGSTPTTARPRCIAWSGGATIGLLLAFLGSACGLHDRAPIEVVMCASLAPPRRCRAPEREVLALIGLADPRLLRLPVSAQIRPDDAVWPAQRGCLARHRERRHRRLRCSRAERIDESEVVRDAVRPAGLRELGRAGDAPPLDYFCP